MSFYEALGIAYVIGGTAVFTAEVIYCATRGLAYMQRLIQRAQTEETLDLQRSLSIKRELVNADNAD